MSPLLPIGVIVNALFATAAFASGEYPDERGGGIARGGSRAFVLERQLRRGDTGV